MTDEHDESSRPDWWRANERLRDSLDLPAYEPSRFADGPYIHEVRRTLEERFDCAISFRSTRAEHPSRWAVYVDGEKLMEMERRRTVDGNNVFDIDSDTLVRAVESTVE